MVLETDNQLTSIQQKNARKREALQKMTAEVKWIMEHSVDDGLRWTGATIDLMEALYYVYEEETLTDEFCQPLSFLEIVRRCTAILHVKKPANPYMQAQRGRERKGVKHLCFMDRYMQSIPMSTYITSCT